MDPILAAMLDMDQGAATPSASVRPLLSTPVEETPVAPIRSLAQVLTDGIEDTAKGVAVELSDDLHLGDMIKLFRHALTDIANATGMIFHSPRKLAKTCAQKGKTHLIEGINYSPIPISSLNVRDKSDLEFICDLAGIAQNSSVRSRIERM